MMDGYEHVTGCQFSLYPLGQADIDAPIQEAIEAAAAAGLPVRVGRLSTLMYGDEEQVFSSLLAAFRAARAHGETVMAVTISTGLPSEDLVADIQRERVQDGRGG
jgi:uncharacterized protein YqgV (UPF0045/DUF77 family)